MITLLLWLYLTPLTISLGAYIFELFELVCIDLRARRDVTQAYAPQLYWSDIVYHLLSVFTPVFNWKIAAKVVQIVFGEIQMSFAQAIDTLYVPVFKPRPVIDHGLIHADNGIEIITSFGCNIHLATQLERIRMDMFAKEFTGITLAFWNSLPPRITFGSVTRLYAEWQAAHATKQQEEGEL